MQTERRDPPGLRAVRRRPQGGQVRAGLVRAEGADALRVTGTDAKSTTVPRADVEELRPSATSIMPVGLAGTIGEARMRDLMAFLMNPPARGE